MGTKVGKAFELLCLKRPGGILYGEGDFNANSGGLNIPPTEVDGRGPSLALRMACRVLENSSLSNHGNSI